MLIVHHAHLRSHHAGGAHTLAAADRDSGITAFEVQLIDLDPGAQLPIAAHPGERVVLALAGQGKLLLVGGPQRFAAPSSLFIPPDSPCQIINNAWTVLHLVMVSSRPVPWPAAPTAMAPSGDVASAPGGNTEAHAEPPSSSNPGISHQEPRR